MIIDDCYLYASTAFLLTQLDDDTKDESFVLEKAATDRHPIALASRKSKRINVSKHHSWSDQSRQRTSVRCRTDIRYAPTYACLLDVGRVPILILCPQTVPHLQNSATKQRDRLEQSTRSDARDRIY